MTERWLPITGYEDAYEVSDFGRVRNIRSGRVLVNRPGSNLYLRVCLCGNGPNLDRYVHRLVCSAFIGPPPDALSEVDHADKNRTNNHWSNLSWTTSEENKQHRTPPAGERNPQAELTETDIRAIRASSVSSPKLALSYPVEARQIRKIRAREAWDHVS